MNEVVDVSALARKTNEFILSGAPHLAVETLKKVLPQYKNNSTFWVLMATALDHMGQPGQAVEGYNRALSIDPNDLQALVLLGRRLHSTKYQAESRALFERALLVNPDSPESLILSVAGALLMADLSDRGKLVERIRRFIRVRPMLFYLIKAAYWAPFLNLDLELEQQIWMTIDETIRQQMPIPDRPNPKRARARSKLRIGYASPNFGDHPVGHVTKSLYGAHDRERFEIYLYSTNPRAYDNSEYKTVIRNSCDKYTDITGLDVKTARAKIAEDEIDIMVDINGYMGATTIIEIFAGRPAPVQVYWLGHAGALGLPFYDYIIGDSTVTPPEEDNRYIESIARLPDTFHCTDKHEISDEHINRGDFGLDKKAFVFCAFCNPTKIDPEVFQAWMQILRAVPGSQLWLSQGNNPSVEANLRGFAESQGIEKNRLVFADRIPDKRRHLGRHRLADLFLDTFTVNASTMAIDALWAELPVLTRPGKHFCSRNCTSFLRAVGLDEMVCGTTEEYINRAVYFGTNPDAIKAVKDKLWENRESYPLFDIKRFTRHLETAYQTMWERSLSGKPPASFPN
jgi:predicted O-linked N-acetylglucosamine transferase (SPINDLY family)